MQKAFDVRILERRKKSPLYASLICLLTVQPVFADEKAGILFSELQRLDGSEFSGEGLLKKAFMQFDESETNYVLQIEDRKYPVNLDDGRGKSQRAEQCQKEEFIGLNSTLGCPITFDAEYTVGVNDASVEVALTIWNVVFLNDD
ncbi:hypothetical protein [Primorskyibacter flagellatus]|uniref:hypothetical protein n=1 Tax=Primorskyibacter flagellatus TaxID=1387277 RepID=UPI003A8EF408